MAYEYEGYVKNTIRTEAVFSHEIEQKYDRILELEEVYRKAKAFDKISNLIEENYVDYGENNLEDIEAIVNEYWEDKQND
ncbi:hypothetical protein ASS95_07155 [Staphylococcus equorum]|uniref:hypothetical protein n=1 Tax=Staphylococcus equorum TaxID=246432 RepID=UPI000853AFF6|nr:hypothetical protein [Staphylococcus equorum]OEK54307.1 hypothetical protein ASS95_07155 [Staphylococcus equorum]